MDETPSCAQQQRAERALLPLGILRATDDFGIVQPLPVAIPAGEPSSSASFAGSSPGSGPYESISCCPTLATVLYLLFPEASSVPCRAHAM